MGGRISCQSPKFTTIWVVLPMIMAIAYLAFLCWGYSFVFHIRFPKTETRYLSTSEVQNLIASSKGRDIRFTLFENASGGRTLGGDLNDNGTGSSILAPAENSTMALLAEKGISYKTKIANRDDPPHPSKACFLAQRLLEPFSCFIVVAGAVTLLRGRQGRRSELRSSTAPRNERPVDRAFAALAACGILAIAVIVGLTTDWKVRRIAADQVAGVIAQRSNARFEVFQYFDGSRKLWISDRRTPEFIAPANESTLGLLTRQGITYQTYVASYVPGTPGYLGRSPSIAVLWILILAAAAGGLLWWVVKSQPTCLSHQSPRTI